MRYLVLLCVVCNHVISLPRDSPNIQVHLSNDYDEQHIFEGTLLTFCPDLHNISTTENILLTWYFSPDPMTADSLFVNNTVDVVNGPREQWRVHKPSLLSVFDSFGGSVHGKQPLVEQRRVGGTWTTTAEWNSKLYGSHSRITPQGECFEMGPMHVEDSGIYTQVVLKPHGYRNKLHTTHLYVYIAHPTVSISTTVIENTESRCILALTCTAKNLLSGASMYLGDITSGVSVTTTPEHYYNDNVRVNHATLGVRSWLKTIRATIVIDVEKIDFEYYYDEESKSSIMYFCSVSVAEKRFSNATVELSDICVDLEEPHHVTPATNPTETTETIDTTENITPTVPTTPTEPTDINTSHAVYVKVILVLMIFVALIILLIILIVTGACREIKYCCNNVVNMVRFYIRRMLYHTVIVRTEHEDPICTDNDSVCDI